MPATDAQRNAAHQEFVAELTRLLQATSLLKPDIRAMIDALDAWWDLNVVAANLAIPQPARGQLDTDTKVKAFIMLLRNRYGV